VEELLPPSRSNSIASNKSGRKNSTAPLMGGYADAARQNGQEQQEPSQQMVKIKQTQEQIAEVTEQLHKNIDMIHERGERLDNLQDKSGAHASLSLLLFSGKGHTVADSADKLSISSQRFKTQATTVRRQMWWKNLKVGSLPQTICRHQGQG
jgi:hypothetical protein